VTGRAGDTSGGGRRELLVGGAHLGALWAFAFAQPLLDLLGKNPDFFVARSNTAGDIVILALLVLFVPPLALLAFEAAVAAVDRRAYRLLHLGLVATIAAFLFVQVEKRIYTSPTALIVLLALGFGALVAYGLARTRFVRNLLDVLSFAPLVFLVIFLFFSDSSKLVLPQDDASALGARVESEAPVVIAIFDELPTATLLRPDGRIDAGRFPGFAALARDGTWYQNNTTVADFTGRAVPGILTGNNPSGSTLPIASDQPNSVFSLLGGAYRLHVEEAVTQLCPESLCGELQRPPQSQRLESLFADLKYVEGRIVLPPALANQLPNVSTTFGDFGNNNPGGDKGAGRFAQDLFTPPNPAEFERFIDRIPPGGRTLSVIHMELPHEPWRFLPDGRMYLDTSVSYLGTPSGARWAVGSAGVASAEQRHILQTAYADRLVGLMIRRLKRLGTWREAMVVVTADHGISFQGGRVFRRIAERSNLGGVANPPLFVKYPGQRRGGASPLYTRTVDIVPTIARRLGISSVYGTQGRPIAAGHRGGTVAILNGRQEVVRVPLELMLRQRRTAVLRSRARLGAGGIYALGPASRLLGGPVPPLSSGIPEGFSATVENGSHYEDVDPDGDELPAFVAGTLEGVRRASLIAVSVNGRLAAIGRAFLEEEEMKYGAVVPPGAFRPGRNEIGVFAVARDGVLIPLGGN
jgi:Sulfatase